MSAVRYTTHEPTSIEVYGKGSTIPATLKNLSATGACLRYKKDEVRLQQGDLICVTVYLAKLKKNHRISAEVIWQNDRETGVIFLNADELFEKFRDKTRNMG